ncbi:PQQ-dependent sugar dehydrogenase [Ornithinimicrobium ciconiae]|uniref:PQQ-dependent sugar dehydrogenase n=1 Tax=Ornithinimicrobium ciconiae TaxID=2594265 RepID=UPI001D18EF2C|nr:PQQ-dependent sugar dehydrogenase [Ornithinimicrobium ciconiae]
MQNGDANTDPGSASAPAPATDEPTGGTTEPRVEAGEVAVAETIATGLHTPWDVDFLADGSALVSLRDTGEVLRITTDGEVSPVVADGPDGAVPDVHHETEDGLLGLAEGPEGGIYLYLTTSADNRVVRYDLEGDTLVNPRVILDGIPTERTHSGGRLAFGPDGYLYITTGDARQTDLSQDTDSLAGKILRVTTEGEPAPGNPFDNEVWSYGHRNVQGLGWTSDGRMYASEFGSDKFDELNLIEAGGNYGWPLIEGWAGDPDYVDPLVTWETDEASPSGIAVTDEGVWMSALRGERLWFVPLGPDGEVGDPVEHDLDLGRLRAVVTAPDGALWVVTSNTDGRGDPSADDDRIVRVVAP